MDSLYGALQPPFHVTGVLLQRVEESHEQLYLHFTFMCSQLIYLRDFNSYYMLVKAEKLELVESRWSKS